MEEYGFDKDDGAYGRKLFYEARGYTVTNCYNQKTDNQVSGGFSFAQFQAEIDAGRPVMLHLAGHTIVGVGYNSTSNLVYIHDTWDYATHTMTWGGSYAGMELEGVSLVNILPGGSRDDFIGTWDGDGVYYRNSISGAWVKLTTPATKITAGDLDGDGKDDLIGDWPGDGIWVKYSQSGNWSKLSIPATDICTGDMNSDGRVDLIGTWDDDGVYYRNSISGAWVKLSTPATKITAGDLDGDGKDDLIGDWPHDGGIWVKYSQSGNWSNLSSTATDICTGDMNSDGRVDFIGTWDGDGVYYRNSISGAWVTIDKTPATKVTAGDLDGDGKDDLIGDWPSDGIWVKYSQSGTWSKLSSNARDIATGFMRGEAGLSAEHFDATAIGPGNFDSQDTAIAGPGDCRFQCQEEKNLIPKEPKYEVEAAESARSGRLSVSMPGGEKLAS